jgi:LacI family transcriptional regulator
VSGWKDKSMTAREVEGPAVAERVTIADVARVAEVSPTTVSHVLSGKRRVRGSTSQRVMDAITELGYRPNSAAQQLRTRRSRMIAVLVPDITNPFYSTLTRGLADTVAGDDYGTFVCNTDGSLQREQKFMHDVSGPRCGRHRDGVGEPRRAGRLTKTRFGTPIVCIGETIDDERSIWSPRRTRPGRRLRLPISAPGGAAAGHDPRPEEAGTSRDRGFCDALAASGKSRRSGPDGARRLDAGRWTCRDARAHGTRPPAGRGLLRERPDSDRSHGRSARARAAHS